MTACTGVVVRAVLWTSLAFNLGLCLMGLLMSLDPYTWRWPYRTGIAVFVVTFLWCLFKGWI